MPSLRIKVITTISKQQFTDALTDFGNDRGLTWGNSQPTHLIIHEVGESTAHITEGSNVFGGAWERLHYDWSQPNIVTLRTVDSNIWAEGSGWVYEFEEQHDSMTMITATVTRYPNSLKGRMLLVLLGSVGKPLIKKSFKDTIKKIEQRHKA